MNTLLWRGDLPGRDSLLGKRSGFEWSWETLDHVRQRTADVLAQKENVWQILKGQIWYERPREERKAFLQKYWWFLPDTIRMGFIDSDIPAKEPFFSKIDFQHGKIPTSYEERLIKNNEKNENWFRFHGYNEVIWKGFIISGMRNGNAALIQHTLCEDVGKSAWKWCIDALKKNWVQEIYTAFSEKHKTNKILEKNTEMYEKVSIDEIGPEIKEKLWIQDVTGITLFRVK